jgi:hypothetical protein
MVGKIGHQRITTVSREEVRAGGQSAEILSTLSVSPADQTRLLRLAAVSVAYNQNLPILNGKAEGRQSAPISVIMGLRRVSLKQMGWMAPAHGI